MENLGVKGKVWEEEGKDKINKRMLKEREKDGRKNGRKGVNEKGRI